MKPFVVFCIPIKNRMLAQDDVGINHVLFPRCFRHVRQWIQADTSRDYTVIIDDWCSTDVDMSAWLARHAQGVDTLLLRCARPGFNRGHSRNRMAVAAKNLGADYLFFLDCDMVIDERGIDPVMRGRDAAVFPLGEKILTPDHSKRREMTGSHGVLYVSTDMYFKHLHPWPEHDTWGGEDSTVADRAKKADIYFRAQTKNYFTHLWHPGDQRWKDRLCLP